MVRDLTGAKVLPQFHSDLLRHRSSINDNHCAHSVTGMSVPACVTAQVKASVSSDVTYLKLKVTRKNYFSKTRTQLPYSYHVVSYVPFAGGSPQMKGVIPKHQMSIKSVQVYSNYILLTQPTKFGLVACLNISL